MHSRLGITHKYCDPFSGCDTVLCFLEKGEKDCLGDIDSIWRCDFNLKNDNWSA